MAERALDGLDAEWLVPAASVLAGLSLAGRSASTLSGRRLAERSRPAVAGAAE